MSCVVDLLTVLNCVFGDQGLENLSPVNSLLSHLWLNNLNLNCLIDLTCLIHCTDKQRLLEKFIDSLNENTQQTAYINHQNIQGQRLHSSFICTHNFWFIVLECLNLRVLMWMNWNKENTVYINKMQHCHYNEATLNIAALVKEVPPTSKFIQSSIDKDWWVSGVDLFWCTCQSVCLHNSW